MEYLLSFIVKLDEICRSADNGDFCCDRSDRLCGVAFLIIVRVAPFSVKKEIEEDQNTSLAIIIGSMIIGMAMIIAAAISGS